MTHEDLTSFIHEKQMKEIYAAHEDLTSFIHEKQMKEIYAAIDAEIEYAEKVVAVERNYKITHTLGEFILMLNQYAAQAQQKWTHEPDDVVSGYPESLHEVRKIAALAVRCMKQHGAPKRILPTKKAIV